MFRTSALLLFLLVAAAPLRAESGAEVAARLNEQGIEAVDAGDYARAIDRFTRARHLLPADLTLRKNLATARSKYGAALLSDGRIEDAVREFGLAAALERGVATYHANLGIALVRAGRTDEARKSLARAILVDSKCASALTELGALEYREGDLARAVRYLERAAAELPGRRDVSRALARAKREYEIEKNHRTVTSAHFLVSFDGEKDAGVGDRILRILEDAWETVGAGLRIFPADRVRVILYTGEEFREVTGSQEWVGGIFDGRIRIPVKNIATAEDEIRETIYHEYTHVAVHSVTSRCPAWLNEGLAQFYEGRDPKAVAGGVSRANRRGDLFGLEELRDSFTRISDADRARLAYAESLSFTGHLLDAFGPDRVGRFLRAIGAGESEAAAARSAFFRPLSELFGEWRKTL